MERRQTSSITGLWPREMPRQTRSEAERLVYQSLKEHLPDGWTAWHSLRIRTRDEGDFGETDFVLADPERPGLLILEVKGGAISEWDGRWFQNHRELPRPPLQQAHAFRRKLLDRFKALGQPYPFIGAAVCFPDTVFEQQPRQDDLNGLVIGRQDLPRLDRVLPAIMKTAVPDPRPAPGRWLSWLHDLWGQDWVPEVRLGSRVQLDQDQRIRLDQDQLAILEAIESNPRMLIQGPAGSGKTVLAREIALRRAEQGEKVLLLCFTEALGGCLGRSLEHPGIKAMAVKRFALELLGREGPTREQAEPSDFWKELSFQAATEGLPPVSERWDLVIVDEGQDLDDEDWLLVEECAAKTGRLWVFADEDQAFWSDPRHLEEIRQKSFVFQLKHAYRCHPAIQNLADCYAGRGEPDPALLGEAIDGGVIRVTPVSETRLAHQVGKEINRLLSEGLQQDWIAVLSVCGRGHDQGLIHLDRLGDQKVCSATTFGADSEIVSDTCFRFKGLERPAVIVTDLRLASHHYQRRMHLAVSRALSVLRVVGVETEIRKDPLLAGLV